MKEVKKKIHIYQTEHFFLNLFTGSISKYIDVILNFGATKVTGDSLMHQLNRNHVRTVFYGDDTWLKLFSPESFFRYEGVSSFYVSDFTEVDNNVTRNLQLELQSPQDWDVMILHYLGLDHIGHIENSFSPMIHIKLQEMDAIIQQIHKELIQNQIQSGENFLLVITGDHGMRDLGGHGGSTKSETLVPLITLGNDCKPYSLSGKELVSNNKRKVEKRSSVNDKIRNVNIELAKKATQVDVTPTLAVLLGLPIPACNTGKLIPKLLLNLTVSELLYTYYYNAKQISDYYFDGLNQNNDLIRILSEHYSLFTKTYPLQDEILSTISAYSEFLSQISSQIIKSSTYVDTYVVIMALLVSTLGTLITLFEPNEISYFNLRIICLSCITYYLKTFFIHSSMLHIFVSYLLSTHLNGIYQTLQSLSYKRGLVKNADIQVEKPDLDSDQTVVEDEDNIEDIRYGLNSVSLTLISLMSMTVLCNLSTSYIENEHNVWMFVLNTFLFYVSLNTKYKSKRGVIISILALHRLLRCINMKWLDEEANISCTLSYWFQMNKSIYLTLFYTVSMISVYFSSVMIETYDKLLGKPLMAYFKWSSGISEAAITASILGSFLYKTCPYYQDYFLLVSLGSLVLYLVIKLVKKFCNYSSSDQLFRTCAVFTILLSVLLFKPYNIVLISTLCVTSHLISRALFPTESIVSILLHLCLGRIYFFLQGSTNSIATIDITAGYIGQSEYNSYIAGSLIYFNMYALNFLAILLLFSHEKPREYANIVRLNFKYISISSTFFLFVIYLQRHHLFIWSVFSPKLLLLSSHNLGNMFILMLLYLFSRKR